MNICKGCFHFPVCQAYGETNKEDCAAFTDHSEWVHLPCEVGDIVFYFDGAYHLKDKNMWKIKPIKVTEFSTKIGRSGKLYPLSIIANGTRYPITSIGKTVFLTREEAERALEGKK